MVITAVKQIWYWQLFYSKSTDMEIQNDSFGFLPGWPIVPYSNLPLPQLENQEQKCTPGLGSHRGKSMGFQVRSLDTETLPQKSITSNLWA